MIKSRTYQQEINKISEILLFGRYKHQTVQHILRTNPQYLAWLHDEKIVKFSDEVWGMIDKEVIRQAEEDLYGGWMFDENPF